MADLHAGLGYGNKPATRRHLSTQSKRPGTFEPIDNAPGICRICRSEGTPQEPLFYPCKCSGSIQHVHQDCLMEWLSHSQKKYCELCKTAFRFTKFYNPNMPQSLPASVFFQQVARYIIENSLGWLRAIIAVGFWITALPWFMRRGWSSMLWLSQESWGATTTNSNLAGATIQISSTTLGLDTCPSSPLFVPNSTPASEIEKLMGLGGSTSADFLTSLARRLTGMAVPTNSTHNFTIPRPPSPLDAKSLLSNVQFLRTLTRNETVNRIVISVLEGQIVTVVVIVSFILVILVRDYVVQQQPEIALRAGFDEDQVPVAVQPARPPHAEESDDSEDERPEAAPVEGVPQRRLRRVERMRQRRPQPQDMIDGPGDIHGREAGPATPDLGDRDTGLASGALPEEEIGSVRAEPAMSWTEVTSSSQRQSDEESADIIYTPDHSQDDPGERASSRDKGKGRMTPVDDETSTSPFVLPEPEAGSSRRRAVSDGPQMSASNVHPLANNTWSFATDAADSTASRGPENDPAPWDLSAFEGPPRHDSPQDDPEDFTVPLQRFGNRHDDPVDQDDPQTQTNGEAEPHTDAESATVDQAATHTEQEKHMTDRLADFMWGDVDATNVQEAERGFEEEVDDGQWFDIPMDDADDLGHHDHEHDFGAEDAAIDAEAGGEQAGGVAPQAGIDPEAMEDMEDFEGIMELLGMRGPITNLFQNVIFCAVLVQAALFACVFTPFNVGRIAFWFAAKPTRLLRIIYELSKVTQDVCFIVGGFLSWVVFNLIDMVTQVFGGPVAAQVLAARKGSWHFFMGAGHRVEAFFEMLIVDTSIPGSGMQYWSAASHEALMSIKGGIVDQLSLVGQVFGALFSWITHPVQSLTTAPGALWGAATGVTSTLANPSTWAVELRSNQTVPVSLEHASWPAGDITWAILAGYISVFTLAGLYLKSGIRVARNTALEEWETGIIDFLHQASGILKVITIISIEMLVFPLYCGLLLDVALLPLFGGASVTSRLLFTYNNPWTSIFVHWFVGTGYMFHFALFVSMCRKIMRPGVLYFIRDPDDPEFHPVRDVLERNLVTQLRKILFSAFVYGALVIVCLGGVVWGLALMAPNVLPIHYSSNEPVLEFPVDLLFYNFFMPLAVRVFKPGDALHTMYRWCFRKSARVLRLTYFLFGERRIDEEGTLHLAKDSPLRSAPLYRQAFLGLNSEKTDVVLKPWREVLDGVDTRSNKSTQEEIKKLRHKKTRLVDAQQIVKDGRFVRAPASDRVKIPKGKKVFMDVDERGRRLDGKPDEGLYASDQFQMVYVPPHLLTRIFLFILLIWTFAAVTGVGLTIIPLVLGRMLFKMAIPNYVKTNDIYAFCIGIHVLGFAAYSVFHIHKLWSKAWSSNPKPSEASGHKAVWDVARAFIQTMKVVYTYSFILIVCPLIMAVLVELYINIPVHTLMNPPTAERTLGSTAEGGGEGAHTIRIVESWTLGLLYMRLAVKSVNSFLGGTRFAGAMKTVLRRGWLEPNVKVLTKAFVLPGLLVSAAAIFGPSMFVRMLEIQEVLPVNLESPEQVVERMIRYRQAYPVVAVFAVMMRYGMVMKGGFDSLKAQVRDDAYLMGERLQNYDGTPPDTVTGRAQRPGSRIPEM